MKPVISARTALQASLVLNVLLAGPVLTAWWRSPVRSTAISAAASPITQHERPSSQPVAATTAPALPEPPFRWSQLDAPDFPTFIKNLRAIGCPEPTIRDIIQGELHEIYAGAPGAASGPEVSSGPSFQTYSPATQAVPAAGKATPAESALLTSLLGAAAPATPGTASAAVDAAATPVAGASTFALQETQAAAPPIPAAFLVGDDPAAPLPTQELSVATTDPGLQPATAAVIERMRTDFGTAMASANSADSTAYRRNWLAAQRQNDEFFSSMFGGDAFVATQAAAAQKQAAQQRSAMLQSRP